MKQLYFLTLKLALVASVGLVILTLGCKEENQKPSCIIISPTDETSISSGDTVAIFVEAMDMDGSIVEINFEIDEEYKGAISSTPYKYEWNTAGTTAGKHIIKATAIDNEGEIKSNEIRVNVTATIPFVLIDSMGIITLNSANCYVIILNNGGEIVTERGICWSTNQNPTIDDNKETNVAGSDSFTSAITGLASSSTYYVRAYATNSKGTSYSNQISFTTYGLVDINGNFYKTVKIGTQTWMAENLKTKNYADGIPIQLVKSSDSWDALGYTDKAYCYYDNSTTNADIYGALYTWAAAMNGAASSSANPSSIQGVCPDGWHLPSDIEWMVLTDYLGGTSVAGGKMKEQGTKHWLHPNTGANNESGFTALPGGYRIPTGSFFNVNAFAVFWSTTEFYSQNVWYRGLSYANSKVVWDRKFSKKLGYSVRCIKD